MKIALWCCWVLLAYTYVGYAFWLKLRTVWRTQLVHSAAITPRISIVLAVRNEARRLHSKLENLRTLLYPPEKIEIIVVSDGSTDETNSLLSRTASERIRVIICDAHVGKAEALNRGVSLATSDIVIFTDVRQTIEPAAVLKLVSNFADERVGCASGELMFGEPDSVGGVAKPLGLYWRFEKLIRKLESQTGSVVGATGAFYAARRELIPQVPPGTILDDVYIPLSIARAGFRVVFESEARAWDVAPDDPSSEFQRKVRTLTGNYQLLELAPSLLSPFHPLWFEFISHKLLRLAAPFAFIAAFCLSVLVRDTAAVVVCTAQVLTVAAAGMAALHVPIGGLGRLSRGALMFVLLNAAAAVAFVNFVLRRGVHWRNDAGTDRTKVPERACAGSVADEGIECVCELPSKRDSRRA